MNPRLLGSYPAAHSIPTYRMSAVPMTTIATIAATLHQSPMSFFSARSWSMLMFPGNPSGAAGVQVPAGAIG